ncbi:ADP-ribosylation factor-like protein 6-interacting protein 4 [Gadus chalcogrammus]|uniref:ADP-ribosylation factor-like protein 6-interacting protein 4 n=1 Tax=Gadus chalcogrammus TaxID=1042646 RepID=UPI0024C49568|nr:ADP-ribosylation factor-like protein 6-interacting protein 4 [Gadus chalcogrammus]
MIFHQLRSATPGNMNLPMVERPERSTRAKGQRGTEGESSDMPTAGKVQWKKRSEELQTRIELLEEENALLKQQLEQRPSAEQGDTVDNTNTEPESNTDASSSSSTDSDSSSSSSSSSDGRKKKEEAQEKSKKKEQKVEEVEEVKGQRISCDNHIGCGEAVPPGPSNN